MNKEDMSFNAKWNKNTKVIEYFSMNKEDMSFNSVHFCIKIPYKCFMVNS